MNDSCDKQVVYIVDVYNPFLHNSNVLKKFYYQDKPWAIRYTTLNWGIPKDETSIEMGDEYSTFHYYDTYEDAEKYVKMLKKIDRA